MFLRFPLVSVHRFPYQNTHYLDCMDHLVKLKEAGKIKNIGLTNFDTEHMAILMDRGAPIVSNQVSLSPPKGIKLLFWLA